MTQGNRNGLLVAGSGLILVVGLVMAGTAWRQLGRDADLLTRRLEELADLHVIGERLADIDEVKAALRKHVMVPPEPDTRTILRDAFPDASPDIRHTRLAVDNGWTREDVELIVSNTSVARIFQFIEAAERARPPLRLINVDLRSRPSAGQVDAAMILVRLWPDA